MTTFSATYRGRSEKGSEQKIERRDQVPEWADTIIGNKTGNSPFEDEIILRKNCQALPLVRFKRERLIGGGQEFLNLLWSVHEEVQGILDKHCNNSAATPLPRNPWKAPEPSRPFGLIYYVAPARLDGQEIPFRLITPSKARLTRNDECAICLDALDNNVVQLNRCIHRFHENCLKDTLASVNGPFCPQCRTSTKERRGRSPAGSMNVSTEPFDCARFPGCGTISITYAIPSAVQSNFHPYSGLAFKGFSKYGAVMIPNNESGRKLLKRLEYAFKQGLSFDVVAASRQTAAVPAFAFEVREANHILSLTAKLSSWSDPAFFKRCNDELDTCGVPPAEALDHDNRIQFR